MKKIYELIPPEIRKSKIIGKDVGIRPIRKGGPRMESEIISTKTIYHNYGHEGSGVSMCYGSCDYMTKKFFYDNKSTKQEIAVLGGGYMGLMTSWILLNQGYKVKLYTDKLPLKKGDFKNEKITSQVAGGLFMPYINSDEFNDFGKRISKTTFDFYVKCIEKNIFKGISYTKLVLLNTSFKEYEKFIPKNILKTEKVEICFKNGDRRIFPAEIINTLLMDGDIFLNDLLEKTKKMGLIYKIVKFEKKKDILKLKENVIFNCFGFSNKYLFGDKKLYGVKGHLLYFERPLNFNYFIRAIVNNKIVTAYPQNNKQAVGITYIDEEKIKSKKEEEKHFQIILQNIENFNNTYVKQTPKL